MRQRVLNAQAWVLALGNGGLFGVLWVLWLRFGENQTWTEAVIRGCIVGVVFGAITGPLQHRQQRGVRAAAARSPEGLSKRVRRAAWRGPIPDDPEVRVSAHRLLVAQSEQLEKQRIWGPAVFLGMAALGVFLAIGDNPWWWLSVVAWIGAAVGHRLLLQRTRRREEVLRSVQPRP